MHVFELTRKLIDIESVTPNEEAIGVYLATLLGELAARTGGRVERLQVEPKRYNVLATWGDPIVTLSTHMDTVPPYFESREDGDFIWGRGACDTKGLMAAMITAVEGLLAEGIRGIALLFVVGEEAGSAGAYRAAKDGRGSRYIINGEPTESKLALGSKGALRFDIAASGRMAHSAYPHLGESAINKLLDALQKIRNLPLPVDATLGPSTVNIGTIQGGRAPNVIPDQAKAEVFFRLVDSGEGIRTAVHEACRGLAEVREVLCIPALRLEAVPGFETTVVAYTTDIPAFNGAWGKPLLFGPGSIHVAHTSEERVPKKELEASVGHYQTLVRNLIRL